MTVGHVTRRIVGPRAARRERGGGRTLALLLGICAWVGVLHAAEIVRVAPLARDGRILVSFELTDAFTEEIRAAIKSGLPTTFSYDVELRREVGFWLDRTVAAVAVTASVRYDTLTRRYRISLLQDGRVEQTLVVTDEERVRQMMTAFERLPLFSTSLLEPNAEYYVRVRVQTRPRDAWFFWPWDRSAASGSAKFTFIP